MTVQENNAFIDSLRNGDRLRVLTAKEMKEVTTGYIIPFPARMRDSLCGRIFTFDSIRDFAYGDGIWTIFSKEGIESKHDSTINGGRGWFITADMVRLCGINED